MYRFKTTLKALGIALATMAAAAGAFSRPALAVTSLKQVQISNGSQIDLLFDGKVAPGQIRTDYINDIIQLSITDVSVYPAKISSVNGGSLVKIFAYQYAPRLVRCRLTVKGKAESYKDKLVIKASGKILTVRVGDAPAAPADEAAQVREAEERALLNRVLAADKAAEKPAAQAEKGERDSIAVGTGAPARGAAAAELAASGSRSTENQPIRGTGAGSKLAGGKPLPSPLRAFGKMGLVLGLFGLCAFLVKKLAQSRAGAGKGDGLEGLQGAAQPGWMGALTRMARKGLGGKAKMIEVLSTHYLGPKKSIAVVRVAGRVLVLGVTNDAINLITQLQGDETDPLAGMDGLDLGGFLGASSAQPQAAPMAPAPKPQQAPAQPQQQSALSRVMAASGAISAGDPVFADLLQAESSKPSFSRGAGAYAAAAPVPAQQPKAPLAPGREPVIPGTSQNSLSSVRAQIKNRLEGLKQL